MKNKFTRFAFLFGLVIILLAVLATIQGKMNNIRSEYHLTDDDPLENAPPMVAFTSVALGGFRGLVADCLWLRSNRMQDEQKYFEMVQLADWLIKLQPRYTASHAFLAWNMAYNVSVTFTNFDDRWRWVKRGYELLRDEALAMNPGDPELFRQLAYIFQHKMGQNLDDANRYYKTEFAKEMIRLFAAYYGRWEELCNAPANESKLRAALNDSPVFWNIMTECGYATFDDFERDFRQLAVIPPEVDAKLQEAGIKDTVEICLRYRWMTQKYRLDPRKILEINAKYGPLDWRLPEAHAIYWAELGREKWYAEQDVFRRISCERVIFQSMAAAFRSGRLVYLKDLQHLEMTPNIGLVDYVRAAYLETINSLPPDDGQRVGISSGYVNFMVDAIVDLYKFGEKKKAMEYMKYGREFNPDRFPVPSKLDDFVLKELAEDMENYSYQAVQGTVQSYLLNAYYQLAIDEDEVAESYLTIARKLYDNYAKQISGEEKRRALPPWDQMKKTSLEMARVRIPGPLAARLNERLPKVDEKFIPEAGEIAAPTVK